LNFAATQYYRAKAIENAQDVIDRHKEDFVLAEGTSVSKLSRTTKLKCLHCNLVLVTSIEAMIAHADAHREKKFIVLGQFTRHRASKNHLCLQTREHGFDAQRGRFSFSTQCTPYTIEPPGNMRDEGGFLYCRNCESFKVAFRRLPTFNARLKSITKLEAHEGGCKGPKAFVSGGVSELDPEVRNTSQNRGAQPQSKANTQNTKS